MQEYPLLCRAMPELSTRRQMVPASTTPMAGLEREPCLSSSYQPITRHKSAAASVAPMHLEGGYARPAFTLGHAARALHLRLCPIQAHGLLIVQADPLIRAASACRALLFHGICAASSGSQYDACAGICKRRQAGSNMFKSTVYAYILIRAGCLAIPYSGSSSLISSDAAKPTYIGKGCSRRHLGASDEGAGTIGSGSNGPLLLASVLSAWSRCRGWLGMTSAAKD